MTAHHLETAQHTVQHLADLAQAFLELDADRDVTIELDGELFESVDDVLDYARELPLELAVRSDWTAPGEPLEPSQFMLLMCTGGPAVRIVGDLDQHLQPENVRLEAQDWGTPWTEVATTAEQDEALEWFAGMFYFGEG